MPLVSDGSSRMEKDLRFFLRKPKPTFCRNTSNFTENSQDGTGLSEKAFLRLTRHAWRDTSGRCLLPEQQHRVTWLRGCTSLSELEAQQFMSEIPLARKNDRKGDRASGEVLDRISLSAEGPPRLTVFMSHSGVSSTCIVRRANIRR